MATMVLKVEPGGKVADSALVEQRIVIVLRIEPVDVGRDSRNEQVGIEARRRSHAQDLPGFDVHHHRRAGFLAEDVDGALLDVGVERQGDVLAGHRRDRAFRILALDLAGRGDLDLLAAGLAAQVLVVGLFDALLADAEAGIVQQLVEGGIGVGIVAFGVQFLLRYLRDIADDVAEGPAIVVGAHLAHVGDHARDVVGVEADAREIVPVQVAGHDGGDEALFWLMSRRIRRREVTVCGRT